MGKNTSIYESLKFLTQMPGQKQFGKIRQQIGEDTFHNNESCGGKTASMKVYMIIPYTSEAVTNQKPGGHSKELYARLVSPDGGKQPIQKGREQESGEIAAGGTKQYPKTTPKA